MMRTINVLIGEKLRELRIQRNLTQEQLAEKLGTDPRYLSAMENGKRGVGKDMLARYCNFFQIPQEELANMLPFKEKGADMPPIVKLFLQRLMELPESEQAQLYSDLCKILEKKGKE